MSDLSTYLQTVENAFSSAAKGFWSKLDRFTYKMLIDGLKGNDYEAVSIHVNQIVKEKKPAGIPPLYVVSKAHPYVKIREKAAEALNMLDPDGEVERLTQGKEMQEALQALVERFGHYKQ